MKLMFVRFGFYIIDIFDCFLIVFICLFDHLIKSHCSQVTNDMRFNLMTYRN